MRALQAFVDISEKSETNRMAFAFKHIHPIRNIIQKFDGARHQQEQARQNLMRLNREFEPVMVKTRLYVSHFIQVLNLAIIREEIPESSRSFYNLPEGENRLPDLRTEKSLLDWTSKIIEGENKRIKTGGVPIMTPTIARVKVWYDQYKDGYYNQITAANSSKRAAQKLIEVRREADALISEVWDEIEEFFSHLPDREMRENCSEYGIVYVFRKGEQTG